MYRRGARRAGRGDGGRRAFIGSEGMLGVSKPGRRDKGLLHADARQRAVLIARWMGPGTYK